MLESDGRPLRRSHRASESITHRRPAQEIARLHLNQANGRSKDPWFKAGNVWGFYRWAERSGSSVCGKLIGSSVQRLRRRMWYRKTKCCVSSASDQSDARISSRTLIVVLLNFSVDPKVNGFASCEPAQTKTETWCWGQYHIDRDQSVREDLDLLGWNSNSPSTVVDQSPFTCFWRMSGELPLDSSPGGLTEQCGAAMTGCDFN